jgi:hypothetical protein
MNIMRIGFLALTVLALVSVAAATQRLVPFPYQHIQDAITAANDGDTVSVWGPPPGQPAIPPWTYYENVDCLGKTLLIVNRSFLPAGGTGYDSSWEHVTIEGFPTAPVVTMTGSDLVVPRVVLKGFTISGGRSEFGGGIHCQDVTMCLA